MSTFACIYGHRSTSKGLKEVWQQQMKLMKYTQQCRWFAPSREWPIPGP
jgi:hypothetical protein